MGSPTGVKPKWVDLGSCHVFDIEITPIVKEAEPKEC
jgi:hypothetical protein